MRQLLFWVVMALVLTACAGNISVGPYTLYAGVYGVPIKGTIHDEETPVVMPTPTQEVMSVATPTLEPVVMCSILPYSGVNVRSGPGIEYKTITSLTRGYQIKYIEKDSEWVEVESPTGVGRAWIYSALVNCK